MAENLFASFDISSQGMSVQRMRLSAVAKNIANANTTKGVDGKAYKREIVAVSSKDSKFIGELQQQINLAKTSDNPVGTASSANSSSGRFMNDEHTITARVLKDQSPPRMVYDPSHPDSNEEGYLELPNINIVTEMVEMISAQRAFEANTGVIEAVKNMARDSLDI